MALELNVGETFDLENLRGSDLDFAELIGRKVAVRPNFLYGVVEAVQLGSGDRKIKIAGHWLKASEFTFTLLS